MIDAINEDTRANAAEQFGAEEARTADSLLNMSGDASEEDDDFAPTTAQQPVPTSSGSKTSQSKGRCRPTKKLEGRQVITGVDAEGCPCAPEAASTKFVTQCGVVVRREFRSSQDSANRAVQKNNNTPCLHTRRKCYGEN